MDQISKLKAQFKAIAGKNPTYPIYGQVKSVENDTCTVVVGELELSDVRLKATADGSDNFLLIPAIGSDVMMLSSDGSIDNLTVVKIDKIQQIKFNQNGLVIDLDSDSGKIGIKNNSVSLIGLFQQLTSLLNGFTLNHPQGPTTGLMPPTQMAIQQFQSSFNQLLKDI